MGGGGGGSYKIMARVWFHYGSRNPAYHGWAMPSDVILERETSFLAAFSTAGRMELIPPPKGVSRGPIQRPALSTQMKLPWAAGCGGAPWPVGRLEGTATPRGGQAAAQQQCRSCELKQITRGRLLSMGGGEAVRNVLCSAGAGLDGPGGPFLRPGRQAAFPGEALPLLPAEGGLPGACL